MLVGTAVAAAAVALLGSLLTRGITRPINLLTARLREIADGDGDLTQRIEHARDDEVGALASVFNRFVENIATLVRQIGQTASTSSAAAQELSVIAADMTQQSGEAARQASVAAASSRSPCTNSQGAPSNGSTSKPRTASPRAESSLQSARPMAPAAPVTRICMVVARCPPYYRAGTGFKGRARAERLGPAPRGLP